MLRVIIPDTHGSSIDAAASRAFLDDLKYLDPEQIVGLGDHVDANGVFSTHPRNYAGELEYSYADDCAAANRFFDEVQKRAPRREITGCIANAGRRATSRARRMRRTSWRDSLPTSS